MGVGLSWSEQSAVQCPDPVPRSRAQIQPRRLLGSCCIVTASGNALPHLLNRIARMMFGTRSQPQDPSPQTHYRDPSLQGSAPSATDPLLSIISEGVFVLIREPEANGFRFRLISHNPAFATLLGLDQGAIGGSLLGRDRPEGTLNRLQARCHQCLNRRQPIHYQDRISIQGRDRILQISLRPLPEHGPPSGSIAGTCRDITEVQRLQTALRQQTQTAQLLQETHQQLRACHSLQHSLTVGLHQISTCFKSDRAAIWRCQPDPSFQTVAEVNPPGAPSLQQLWLDHSWYQEQLYRCRQGHLCVIDDLSQLPDPRPTIPVLERYRIRSMVILPLLLNDRCWGAIALYQSHVRCWQLREVELLRHLGDQLAMAIQHHELSEQMQHLNDRLQHQVHACMAELQQSVGFAALLRQITDQIRNTLEERVISEIAVRELTHMLDLVCCQMGYFQSSSPGHDDVYDIQHTYGLLSGTPSQPLCLITHPETCAVIYQRLRAGETLCFCVQEQHQRSWVLALICPISDPQGVIGAVVLYRSLGSEWTPTEIRFVEQVASQCAVGIRQARLYQAAQDQVLELERLNQRKDDFLSTVSHELRTPLVNMKMSIQMLKLSQTQTPLSPKQQDYLAMLENECYREADLITDLLDLQHLEAHQYPYQPQQVDLHYWLSEVVRAFQLRAQERDLHLSLQLPQHLPPFWLDPDYLKRILRELLTNACKYTPPQGQIQVRAQLQTDPSGVTGLQIGLSNTVEIPSQELPHLFERFYRVLQLDQWQQGGTGLGLSLVQRLVEGLSGRIEVVSQEGWTHFTVWIPKTEAPTATSLGPPPP